MLRGLSLRAFALLVVLQRRHLSRTYCLENLVNKKHVVLMIALHGRHF